MRKTKQEAEKTYISLLEAAADLFLQKGVSRTTLQDIADHANMTKGAVYWHFKGKEDIIRALMETYAIPRLEQFDKNVDDLPRNQSIGRHFRQLLQNSLLGAVGDKRAAQALAITVHMVEFTSVESDFQDFMQHLQRKRFETLSKACKLLRDQSCLRDDLAPEQAARGLLCYILGLMQQHYSRQPLVNLTQEGPALLDIYLDSILPD